MSEIVLCEANEIRSPVAQRRHLDSDDVEPEIKIFAESAIGDAFLEVATGGGDDAHLGFARDIFAEPLIFTFLKQTEQFGLNLDREIADFIEEQGAARGDFDFAPMVAHCASEGAFDMAEKVAFEQLFGEAGTTDSDERFIRQMALLVNGAGDNAFSSTAFTHEQDRGMPFRRSQQSLHYLAHERRGGIQQGLGALGIAFFYFLFEPFDALA